MGKTFVSVALMLVMVLFLVGTSVGVWCDSDFAKRINVSVNNTAGSALTNYQVYVNLSSNPINETSLRVYNSSDCTLRHHWTENETGGNSYGVWINYSAIAASSWVNNTAIYYENSSATSNSSGNDTFILFDDFLGTSLNTNKWTNESQGTGSSVIVTSGECELHVPDDQICSANIQSIDNFTNNIAIHVKRKCPSDIEYIGFSLGNGSVCDESGGTSNWWRTTKKSSYWWLIADANVDPNENEIYKMPASGAKVALTNINATFSDNTINNFNVHKYIYENKTDLRPLGESFEKNSSNPFSLPGDSTGYGATHPDVLYFDTAEDGYKYWMYYEKGTSASDCDVYLVRSNDGFTWVETGVTNPILTSINGESHIPDPDIIKIGSTWYMFVMAGASGTSQIYRLNSTDGKSWSNATMIIDRGGAGTWDNNIVVSPSVIYESGTFYLWYGGGNSTWYQQVGLATSTDGTIFTKDGDNPIFSPEVGEWDDQEIWHLQVTKYNNKYWLYYVGKNSAEYRIGLAKSTDRENFTRSSYNPVLVKSGSGWESNFLYRTSWLQNATGTGILLDSKMWQYYSAYGGTYYKIGLAKSWENMGTSTGILKWYLNNTLKANVSNSEFLNTEKEIMITQGAYSATGRGTPSFLDWIFVRKYTSPEVSGTLGSEEQQEGGTTPVISNVQNGSVSSTAQYINWTVNQTTHNRVLYSNESDLTPAYYSTWDNSTAVPNITLNALDANTQYWYQAWSYNTTNTSLTDNSSTMNFTTAAGANPTLHIDNAINIKEDWGRDFNSNLSANVTTANASGVWMNFSNAEFTNTSLGWLNLTLNEWVNDSHNVNSPVTNISVDITLNSTTSNATNDTESFYYEITNRTNTATMDSAVTQNVDTSETFYVNATCNEEYSDTFLGDADLLEDGVIIDTDSSVTDYVNFSHSESSAGQYNYTVRFYNLTHYDNATTPTYSNVTVTEPTYIPPDPVNLQNTSGDYWVNYTWDAGSVNVTDLYNVSWNLTWYNDTSVTYMNDSVGAGNWANITVYAFNSSGTGTLSSGSISDEVKVSDAPQEEYIPPDPTTLVNSTGNFWVNHTWSVGTPGNVTDSYNVSIGAVWHNTTTVTYHNDTGLSAHDWSNVTVWAYNTSGSGSLSNGNISDNVRIPNNAVTLTVTQNYEKVETETVFISDTSSSDTDSDTPTYSCNRTDLFADFSTSTGYGNWTTGITDSGTYYVNIGVSDGWGSSDNKTLTITINDATPGTPSNLANSTGNFWVNHTWNIGTNTDTFNISVNSTWTNDTSNEYYNNTDMIPHNWSNITVYGFNSTSSELSGSTSQNTQIPNNVPILTGLPDNTTDEDINRTDIFDLDDYFTDVDSDTPTYLVESNNQSANVSVTINASNNVSYTLASGWNGTASVVINVTDGWGGEDNDTFLIVVNAPPGPGDYIPGDPTTLGNTTGNYWVNYTWNVGGGNVTDSYNVSWNLTWYNTTTDTFMKKEVGATNWGNITVYAYNSSGNGTLSGGSLSDNVQAPAYVPNEYPPATPTSLANTTGNGWVNYTWSSGGGANVTDSYNVSWNLTWYNTTLTAYMNDTVGEFGWGNITVWAYNSTGNGSLSAGNVSDDTQAGGGTYITSMTTTVYNLITYYGSTTSTAEQFGVDIGNVDYVAMYNGSFWSHTMGFVANNFTTYHGIGYYVFLNASGSSTYQRNNISDTPYNTQLFNRWNTVGWTNATDTNAEGVASSIGSACKYTSSLNADGVTYTTHTVGFASNNHDVTKGKGYWVWVNTNTNWGRNS